MLSLDGASLRPGWLGIPLAAVLGSLAKQINRVHERAGLVFKPASSTRANRADQMLRTS